MKMKLAQRLLAGYYSGQLKLIGLVSPQKAARKAFTLFCTPFAPRPGKNIPGLFQEAEPLSFLLNGLTIRGFRWIPQQPNGKKILLSHGFRSYSYKFEPYILPLLNEGFEVIMFDAPAHGTSDGKSLTAILYKDMIVYAEKNYGPFFGFIAHSLGGLAVALALEEFESAGRKIVLIAPATETSRAVSNFFEVIHVSAKVQNAFEQYIFNITGKHLAHYSIKRVVSNLDTPVLWIHDRHDRICPYEDMQPMFARGLPHVQFHITEQLGHNQIYKAKAVNDMVVAFMKPSE